jgi:CBS domain containing-hemolysin-like protein
MQPAFFILLSLLALVFGTGVVAARLASRTRLLEILEDLGRPRRIEDFDRHQQEYAVTAMIYRQLCIVLFVIAVGMRIGPTDHVILRPLWILLISTAWFLLFGVAFPTAWAKHAGEAYMARMLGLLELLRRASWPALAVVRAVDEVVRRLAGAPGEGADPGGELERDLLDVVSQAETTGAVDQTEKDMIKSVINLDETSVAEIMTPRTDMVGIESTAAYDEARRLVLTAGHSRIPVYEETLDHVVGILHAKDLLRVEDPARFSLKETMRAVTYVPETKDLASLLGEFQANRVHLAIVLDEYGGTAGLLTIEDILEELVGEITDEHEKHAPPPINRLDEKTAEVDARVRVEELNEELEIELPEDEAYDTIGGYVFSKLGRIPIAGERFEAEGVRMEVLEAQERTINRVRIEVLEPSPGGTKGERRAEG